VVLGEPLLQRLLRILHGAGQIPHKLGGQTGTVSADLFLDCPRIVCLKANVGRLALYITAWGPVTITAPNIAKSTHDIVFSARVLIRPALTLQGSSITFGLQATTATVDTITVESIGGGAFSAIEEAFLGSPTFEHEVQQLVRTELGKVTQLAPPLSVAFLGPVATAAFAVTGQVVDGALALGLDADFNGSRTSGDPNGLVDSTGGNDVGVWMNPSTLSLFTAAADSAVRQVVSDQGATLNSLAIVLLEGKVGVSGQASKAGAGSVAFSLDLAPRLIVPARTYTWTDEDGRRYSHTTPAREELWFEPQNVQIDVYREWWIYLVEGFLAVLSVGIAIGAVESFIGMIRNNIYYGVKLSGGVPVSSRNQDFVFAGTAEPVIHLRLEQWGLHADGIFTGITLKNDFRAGSVSGTNAIEIEEAATARVHFTVTLPFGAFLDDPLLRIRWTARRSDSGAIIDDRDLPAQLGTTFDLTGHPVLLEAPAVWVSCRVYRPLGSQTTEVLGGVILVDVEDRLDRSHPYVRWSHVVKVPNVVIEADGSRTFHGMSEVARTSALHRTAYPGRCRMATAYSTSVHQLDYLDGLPFPRSQLDVYREQVCDYCFYGGPTKTAALIP